MKIDTHSRRSLLALPLCKELLSLLFLAACGASNQTPQSGDASTSADGATTEGGTTEVGEAGVTVLSLPQFVHGAARVDTAAFPKISLVVAASGPAPASVQVSVDGATPLPATSSGSDFVATLDTSGLAAGPHTIKATATAPGQATSTVQGSLVAASGSLQFTVFAKDGAAYASHLVPSPSGDSIGFTWVDYANGKTHQLYLNYFDGSMTRLSPTDSILNDPADEPLTGYTAFGTNAIGAVYNTANPTDGHWLVKMRITDLSAKEIVPVMNLTAGNSAFSMAQAGVDPGGFSAAWLNIGPPGDGGAEQPVEVRFARYDMTSKKLVGPIVLDSDQPQAAGSTQGTQSLEPLAEMGIACNTTICLVSYTRDVYNSLVELNIPKLFLATVDIATGKLVGTASAVEDSDWDTQMFGQHLITLADGSFLLVYTANDTATAVNPMTPCDMSEERDLLFAVKIDATGKQQGNPAPIFDNQGTREYPRVAPHPDGYALFWEDQRSYCTSANGHIAMAMNVVSPELDSLLDPYLEAPGSIVLPPEDPTLTVTGTNFVSAWTDARHGDSIVMPESEIYMETYWRN